ncbi:MAG TPA: hypothetical protein VKU41_24400 [Polyangiaceae bacterium]|nr:hypothetical protein [Polyangiaceae bacterium]
MNDASVYPAASTATATAKAARAAGAAAPGQARFATADERDVACLTLSRAGMVVAELGAIGASCRGRLAHALDEAIEHALALQGAPGAGLASVIVGENDRDEAAVWSERDAILSDQLSRAKLVGASGIGIVVGPLRAATAPIGALAPEDCLALRFLAHASLERPVALLMDAGDARSGAYVDPVPLADVLDGDAHATPIFAPSRGTRPAVPAPEEGVALAPAPAAPTPTPPAADALFRHVAGASVVEREETWRAWTLQLTAARGVQPLSALEKLFTESYMPLANAVSAGLDDPRARAAQDEFRATFSKLYVEAFPTFAATTKRPRMVLDAHEVAARIARLHGARSTRLLLVDGMRWDVSRLVHERVALKLGARASVTDELLLWSALPTTTIRQLETLARGVEALRSPSEIEADIEPPRGRSSEYVRRMRVGPREVHKLDLVEARVRAARGNVPRALPDIADGCAEVIARHAETLAPYTLLFVFGDHGFTIDRHGITHQGGPSPEEVLVGAFALLVGDVH